MNNEKQVAISIIVSIFNIDNWLDKCLSSILSQSFDNFEVILVDDGSEDRSKDICMGYVKRDKRFRYFYKKNGGLSSARNFGINKSVGKYLVFVDGDDFLSKDYLDCLYYTIIKYKADVAMCNCNIVNENGNIISTFNLPRLKIIAGKDLLNFVFLKDIGLIYTVVWNKIFKRKLFSNIKFSDGKLYEDEFINPTLYWNIKRIVVFNKSLYNYVQRKSSIINSSMNSKKINDGIEALTKRIFFYRFKDICLYKKAIKFVLDWLINITKGNKRYFIHHKTEFLKCSKQYRKYYIVGKRNSLSFSFKEKIFYLLCSLI